MGVELSYYMPVLDSVNFGNIIYSCDMLRLKFICNLNEFEKFMNNLCYNNVNYKYYQSFAFFKYRHIWTIDFGNSTMTIGYFLNTGKSKYTSDNGFVEFNPNKCIIDKEKFFTFYNQLSFSFKYCEIVRYDIAIDLPLKRQQCHFKRFGNKTYTTIQKDFKNEDLTEYLGLIHSNGTIKLYNKTIESKLSYELTRYEFTYDSLKYNEIEKILPEIYIDNLYNKICLDKLSSTEKVLLHYLLNDNNFNVNFNMLSRSMKQKLLPYIEDSKQKFKPNINKIKEILNNMRSIFEKDIYNNKNKYKNLQIVDISN